MSKQKIENVGELRAFLVTMMVGVKDGLIDGQDARDIVKLAAQINESFYSEIKVAKLRHDIAGEKFRTLGATPIGDTSKEGASA